MAWTQQCALWLGHESAAVLAVVAAFFGGLSLGAWAMGPRIERSTRPVAWYAGCELLIAAWGVVLLVALNRFSDAMLRFTGAQPTPTWQWTVAFVGLFVLLLPATAAMGATLPAIERMTMRVEHDRSIAADYASNTIGAVVGVLATSLWLVPTVGLSRTLGICIVFNVLCGATAFCLFSKGRHDDAVPVGRPSVDALPVLLRLAATGFLGIGFEVVVVRVLSQVTEDTIYTFAMLLVVYLAGSAAGAAGHQLWLVHCRAGRSGDRLFAALATGCLVATVFLASSDATSVRLLDLLPRGMASAVASEAMLALAAFALPTIVMGALFSHLTTVAKARGVSFGQAIGINMLGATAAPPVFGVLVAPALGAKAALLAIVAGYLALMTRRAWSTPVAWVPAAATLVLAVWAPPLVFVDRTDGARVVYYREGVLAAVSVVEDADGVMRLRINNRQQEGSSASRLVESRQALLPLLLHPSPRRALFLGLGTGMTVAAAASDPSLQVDAVELLPEVVGAAGVFADAGGVPSGPRRGHVITADARRFVKTTPNTYDVIVSDNFHPARSGSGALYTVEHFEAVRSRLAAGGVFCQWLPLHQLDVDTLRIIVRSFVEVFPQGSAMLASNSLDTPVVGLIGREGGLRLDMRAMYERLSRPTSAIRPADVGIDDELALLGSFIAGPKSLARFAAPAPVNTDDHPLVIYRAPRITYDPVSRPRDRLEILLDQLTIEPDEIVEPNDAIGSRRLAAYWSARNRYIEAGRDVRPVSNVVDMLSQVRQPLLSVLAISPDFRPAYDPLLRMATTLATVDVAAARALLAELVATSPARSEAGLALRELEAKR